MKAPSLSKSTPRSGNGNSSLAAASASITSSPLRTRTGTDSVQPVAMSVRTIVWTKRPAAEVPACATKSTSTKPGGGSFQSPKVRTGTERRTAELKPARRRARPEQRAAPRYGSSPDSPLERRGFEPPVSFADRVAFFRRKKRSRRSIGIIPKRPIAFRDRWFESGSLQQRVGCEIDHAAQLRAILHASTLRQRVFGFAPDLCVS